MSKYQPLGLWLRTRAEAALRPLSFSDIEQILGRRLPPSARRHRGWWANEATSHVQARAWMSAGWVVWEVDLQSEKVRFVRAALSGEPNECPPALSGGVEDTAAPFARDDVVVVSRAALRGGAMRLLEDHCEASGGSLGDAVAAILNGLVVERRRQLLERFPKTGAPSTTDSAELIRQDRDAR